MDKFQSDEDTEKGERSYDTELDILIDIRDEIRNLSMEMARIDERSRATSDEVTRLREERVIPVEKQANTNSNRSQRNAIIISGGLTVLTILFTWGLGIVQI
jgi:hypothetical protein